MDEINYKNLRHLQQLEKNSPTLTHIDSGFYNILSDYLKNLDSRISGEDASSQKHRILEEEIHNTKKIALNIYEQREKKILLAAITKARGGDPDLNNLVDMEKNLFNSILEDMAKTRHNLFESNQKQSEEPIKVKKEEKAEKNENTDNNNSIVRVNETIPEFVGTDTKKYNLRKGDVLSIQTDMKNLLSKRNVVEEIEK